MAYLQLGCAVEEGPPSRASKLHEAVLNTNAADRSINVGIARCTFRKRSDPVSPKSTYYEFPGSLKYAHDLIDPAGQNAKVIDDIYRTLRSLLGPEETTTGSGPTLMTPPARGGYSGVASRPVRADHRVGRRSAQGGYVLRYRLRRMVRTVATSFWFWPILSIAFALWLSWALGYVVRSIPAAGITPDSLSKAAALYAGTILTATAAADITILTFVFSTLMVVLQLASSQLSPRIIRTIVRDGSAQLSMAIMVGGFVFSLSALLNIYGDQDPLVAAIVVGVALLWTVVVVLTFLRFVSYVIGRMRAPAVIRSLSETVAHDIRHIYTQKPRSQPAVAPEYAEESVVAAPHDGVVTGLRMHDLALWAERNEACVKLEVGLGDHVSAGVPIGRVASARPLAAPAITRFISVERERTVRGDPPYGFRLLVDIANRALSPAVNDPTTASQVLDELESLLVLLAQRPEEPGQVYDATGVVRVDVPVNGWRSYLLLAVQEIYEFGRASSQVTQRIDRMLTDLAAVVTGDRLLAVQQLQTSIVVVPPLIAATAASPADESSDSPPSAV